jgi:hypothetical protein
MGCISPVRNTVKDTWEALLAGKSGAGMITAFDASKHKTRFAAEVKEFDAATLLGNREARKMDRFTQFATVASLEALAESGLALKVEEGRKVLETGSAEMLQDAAWACGLSAIAGFLAIAFLMSWLKSSTFLPFVIYRLLLGGFLLYLVYVGL